jgi:2-dehydropantoate 2-reductase
MRIAVMGSGGVGGYFGARLALSGSDVTFIARGRHLAAMREHGLHVESALGDMHVKNVKATDDPATIDAVDLVMVGVKLWDTETAAQQILPLIERGAAAVSFQNGVLKDDVLRDVLGSAALMGGVGYIATAIKEPGVIAHTGQMQRLIFGEFDGSRSARAEAFLEACTAAGINAELSGDVRRAIWEKFVFLVGLSGATTSSRLSIGPIRENPQSRAFLTDLIGEAAAVGRAMGVALPEDFVQNRLTFIDTLPGEMTSSMHHDLQRGNPLEVPWLSGGVVTLGKQVGVPTPCNRAVADILAPHAAGKLVA